MSFQAYDSATDTLTPLAENDYKDSLEEISALPTASADLLNKCYLLIANQVGYVKGGIYQCQLVNASYTWVLISSNPLEAGGGITIEDDVISADTNVFNGTIDEFEALSADEQKKYSHIADEDSAGSGTDAYSTTETKTNKVWIDGKPIYRKVLTGLTWTTNSWTTTSSAVFVALGMDKIVNASFSTATRGNAAVQINKDSATTYSLMGWSTAASGEGMCIIEYTKTTD